MFAGDLKSDFLEVSLEDALLGARFSLGKEIFEVIIVGCLVFSTNYFQKNCSFNYYRFQEGAIVLFSGPRSAAAFKFSFV